MLTLIPYQHVIVKILQWENTRFEIWGPFD